jgi:hypothetical protein
MTTLTVGRQFQGPANSGNGGYTAGLLAGALLWEGAVEVTLRKPPPLEAPMQVDVGAPAALRFGDHVIATATPAELAPGAEHPVPWDTAVAAEPSYSGFVEHPFPGCFACGVDRNKLDALALHPGWVADGVVAAAWEVQPWAAERPEVCWAALDCPSGWSIELVGRPAVLGRITAQVLAAPAAGERCVVVGQFVSREGRKAFARATLWGEGGSVLARAATTWIEVDPASVQPPS